jgi:Zn-dependent membrane protease YugP
MIFDPLYLLFMIPGLILMLWAQSRVKNTYAKYGKTPNYLGVTGAQAARQVLDANGLYNVPIEQTPGELTDHYDPRTKVLRLSAGVYNQPSVAAIGVASHEAGHAVQDAQGYAPLRFRTAIVPAVSIGSNLGFILLFAGIIIGLTELAWLGVALFGLGTLFALVTLPVEFDASQRAKATLTNLGLATREDSEGVAKMLNAAAWTYIASFATAVLQLLYYVMLVTGMSRSND